MIHIKLRLPETLFADRATIVVAPKDIFSYPIPIMIPVERNHALFTAIMAPAFSDRSVAVTAEPSTIRKNLVLEVRYTRKPRHGKK